MQFMRKIFRLGLPVQVLIGSIVGILSGLFFGDYLKIIQPIGTIYVMLLQAAVYPYIISTLLSGLGKLSPTLSKRLFKKGWAIYLSLILITFGTLAAIIYSIPRPIMSIDIATNTSTTTETLLDMLIPSNFFAALAYNFIPAVVVFCILFGVVLQHTKKNSTALFEMLDQVADTCVAYWRKLVKFSPLAAAVLLSVTFGTIQVDQIKNLSGYLILLFIITFFLTFWVLPSIITSLIPISYRSFLIKISDALLIGLATTLSIAALPFIYKITHELAGQPKAPKREVDEVINTTLVVSYPFGQVGNFFVWLFMTFVLLYYNHSVSAKNEILLPIISYFSSIGSPSTVVNSITFLSSWLGLPLETNELFVTLLPITRYAQVLISVMGIGFMTLLISYVTYHRLQIRWVKLIMNLIGFIIFIIIIIFFVKNFMINPDAKIYQRFSTFYVHPEVAAGVRVVMMPAFDETKVKPSKNNVDSLFTIQHNGVIRVGYNADTKPFAFFNSKGDLTGFDVEFMYALAKSLNVRIEFIPYTWTYLVPDMLGDKFDIAIGGLNVTPRRLTQVAFSAPYGHSSISLIVQRDNANQFMDANTIRNISNLKIGTINGALVSTLRENFPNAQVVLLPNIMLGAPELALKNKKIDIVACEIQLANLWVLEHPNYVTVIPRNLMTPILLGYMVRINSPRFLNFLNYWLQLQQNNGLSEEIYNHWILMRPIQEKTSRWSILQNVF